MRKIQAGLIAGFLISLLFVSDLAAQAGLKGGVNFSTLSQKGADLLSLSWGSYTGFTIGGFYTFGINNYLAFQPELYFSRKGGKLEGSIGGFMGSKSIDIDYLEIPLLMKLRFPTQSKISPSVFIGPYGAYKLSSGGTISILGFELEEGLIGITDSDFGLVFGGAIDYQVSNVTVILDIRYDLGLVNVGEPILGVENEIKTRSLILMLGFGL